MERVCAVSGTRFTVTDDDLAFYSYFDVPPPTLCPTERQRRRLAWRNERSLYRRTCDATGKQVISVYPPEAPFPVYHSDVWWSDSWDPLSYGRPFDFSRPFFDQFGDLKNAVPQIALQISANENSEYVNLSSWNKDCYLVFESDNNRDCLYCEYTYFCARSLDSSFCTRCEGCFDCLHADYCYDSQYLESCENCAESYFLRDCIACNNCIGCTNLRNKRYWIFNEPSSAEEYAKIAAALRSGNVAVHEKLRAEFAQLTKRSPRKYFLGKANEDSSGNYLWNCKDARECYDVRALRSCKHVFICENTTDAMDVDGYGGERGMQRVYETHATGNGSMNVAFCTGCFEAAQNMYYSDFCSTAHDLFGCVGVRHRSFCILNTQYAEPEYRALRAKIVEHMRRTGEWGEFFPISHSPFAYNETVAHEYFPLRREEAAAFGARWRDVVEKPSGTPTPVPPVTRDTDASITQKLFTCPKCFAAYQVQKSEHALLVSQGIPIPRVCHNCRHLERASCRAPRAMVRRDCASCGVSLRSAIPDRMGSVLCERCWEESVR